MIQETTVEQLLEEAIRLLVSCGYPLTADHLRPSLSAIENAPTAAAKRRRVLRLVEMIDRGGAVKGSCFCADEREAGRGVRFQRTPERSETEARYRALLRRIREIGDGSDQAA